MSRPARDDDHNHPSDYHRPGTGFGKRPELVDFSPLRGVLIERDATDRDHDRGVDRFESYDGCTDRVQEYVSVAEAEDLDLIDDATAETMRAAMRVAAVAQAMRGAA